METPRFKIVIVGDGRPGKTTLIKRLMNIESTTYSATMAYEIHNLAINTNRGVVNFEVWDTSGQEYYENALRQHIYENAHGAILMFGFNSRISFKSVHSLHFDVVQNNGHIPFALIGTFAEKDLKIKQRDIDRLIKRYPTIMQPFTMSTTTNPKSDLAKPFLRLAEALMGMAPETLHQLV